MGTITTVATVTGGLVENQSLASNTLAASAITASSTIMATGAISASNFSGSSSGTNTGDQTITLTSDVTGSGTGSIVTTIAAGAVTLSKMANLAANSIIGNNTGSSATPIALTETQVTAMLNVFSSSLQGLVPASGGGTINFLRADGTFAAPTGTVGANQTLSNLTSPVAANQSISPGSSLTFDLGTSLESWRTLYVATINSEASTLNIETGSVSVGSSPSTSVNISSGGNAGTGATGGILLESGSISNGTSTATTGEIDILSGNVSTGPGNSGNVVLETGVAQNGTSGSIEFITGGTGFGGAGTSGDILLQIGSGPTAKGTIKFQDGSEGTAGYVWTSINNSGSGTWMVSPAASAITSLTSDVSATGPGAAAATVNSVGGSSAANIHSAELAANAATSANTPSTIVKRDSSGNFVAGTITASLTGHASLDLALTGGTMSGDIAMGGNKVTGLASGTVSGDALQYGQIGAANGIAPLDGSGKVPYVNLPSALMTYKGAWDPTDLVNTLTALDPSPLNGDVFRASVDGVAVAGNGAVVGVQFYAGDFAIYNGTAWQRSPLADGVVSVNGASGAVILSVASSNGLAGTYTGTILTLSTTITGLLKGNGTAISAASAGTDYQTPLSFTDSLVNSGSTVTLVNDSASPGASQYYGTNSSSTLGYYSLPSGGVQSMIAGQSFSANTSYLVRMGIANDGGTYQNRVYAADNGQGSGNAATIQNFWVIGIANGGGSGVSAGGSIDVMMLGSYTLSSSDSGFATATNGQPVYLSTSGSFTVTPPSISGSASVKVGTVQSTGSGASSSLLINGIQLIGIN